MFLALIYGLATSAYSVGGRAIWQHSPSMLLLAIIILMLLKAEDKPSIAAWVGIPVALSYTVRPTDSLFVLVFTIYVAVRFRKHLLAICWAPRRLQPYFLPIISRSITISCRLITIPLWMDSIFTTGVGCQRR